MDQGLVEITIKDLLITVDSETAQILLNDQDVANQYYEQVKNQMTAEKNHAEVIIWKNIKANERDIEATHEFLTLRLKYDDQFKDKKTCKNTLWMMIANEMNDKNFYVGNGIDGRERCRHKFSNLQSSYFKYIDKMKQTGEGKVKPPLFYDELDSILGDKHKSDPILIIDSGSQSSSILKENSQNLCNVLVSNDEEYTKNVSRASTSEGISGTLQVQANKFENIKKSVRPSKNKLLEKFYNLNKANSENREKEVDRIMTLMEKQADQRHAQIMALLENKNNKEKKRKRRNSDESD